MKNYRDQKGITLIALVITIIVMLVLVSVTINMAVNGGLFGYAGNAAEQTKLAIEDEQKLGNLREGMTTDQLIAKFTNYEADLRRMHQYFIEGQKREGSEEEGIVAVGGDGWGTGYEVWQYNGNFYKVTWVEIEEESRIQATKVELVEGTPYTIMLNGIYLGTDPEKNIYYKYNNKRYKIVENTNTGKLREVEYTPKEITDYEGDISCFVGGLAFQEMYEYEDINAVSNNEGIVKVSYSGVLEIQGVAIGETTVTLTGQTSGKTKNVAVTVEASPFTPIGPGASLER